RLALATGRGLGAHRTRRPERRRPPYTRHTGTESNVGWSTPRVGHQARPRGTPHSAAGKTPTALRQAHRHGVDRRVVNASRWPPGAASVHTALGGRKDADRPTPGTQARSRSGWSTPRVGHRARPRCTPHSAAGKTPAALIPPNGRPSGTTAGKLRTLLRFPVSVMPLSNIEILHQD